MNSLTVEELATYWAPLPRPLIRHILGLIETATQDMTLFSWHVALHRSTIFDRMHPKVVLDKREDAQEQRPPGQRRKRRITTTWLLGELSALLAKEFARSTLGNWHQRGFFSYLDYGRPQPGDIAQLLTYLTLVAQTARQPLTELDLLPSTLDESNRWCWKQATPTAPPLPWMIPTVLETTKHTGVQEPSDPEDLALYWSLWPGEAWDTPRWVLTGGLGAVTCGYLLTHEPSTLHAKIVEQFLAVWRPQLLDELSSFRDPSHHGARFTQFEMPATLLRVALWKLAEERLASPIYEASDLECQQTLAHKY